MHWYSQTPFRILPASEYSFLRVQEIQLNEIGFQVLIAETTLGLKPTYATFLINRLTGGFAVGTSSGKAKLADIEKSFTEACTNLFLVNGETEESASARIADVGVRNLGDHRAFWLKVGYIPAWIFEQSEIPNNFRFTIQQPPRFELLVDNFMPVVGVRSDEMLQLHIGPPNLRDLRLMTNRLSKLGLKLPAFENVLTHPIP